jgi:glycosyltransferase involved in cell wall biosynthesis
MKKGFMKIVHCFYTLEMGGAQVLAVDLLNKMCLFHKTTLIIVNNVYSNTVLQRLDKRITVHKVNRKEGSRNPWPLLRLNLLLLKLKPDIIHCHEPDIGRIIKIKAGKKIYTIHDVGIPTTYYHHFDALVAISDAVQQDVAHRYHRPIHKVYNGIDTSAFQKRKSYNIASQTIKLVQLSRLMHEKKGQDILLQALRQIKDKYGVTNFTMDFVGVGASLDYLKEMVAKLNLSKEVHFLGEKGRDWLFSNLAQYHLLVQPSRYEGFGLTILEGFATGLPVLASDIEGPAEIINRTPRGFLFKSGDSEDCAEMLYHIIQDYEKGNIEKLMAGSVPVTDQEYSIESCVEGYLNEYKALLA